MSELLACPVCTMTDLLEADETHECGTCGHVWPRDQESAGGGGRVVKDSNGNVLQDGDSVLLIKDLKVKGGGGTLKMGTRIKGIRLVDGDHQVDAKVEGMAVLLKAEFLKKA